VLLPRVRYEWFKLGGSQTALSLSSGIPQPTLSLILAGRLIPTPIQLQRLANVLNVHPPEALLKNVEVVISMVEVLANAEMRPPTNV
jgi:transcriptional regulator with XRE-family HTH domain